MERTITITGTHADGSTMIVHTMYSNDEVHYIAWTIELMRHCGYTEIEIKNN